MGTINTKYAIHDKVFRGGIMTAKKQHACPDCKGSREWRAISPAGDEFSFACPRCATRFTSNDALSLDYSEFVAHVTPLTIGSVRVDTNDTTRPVSYMCVETGVGSGSVYDENELFETEEAAREAAKARAAVSNKTTEWVATRFNRTLDLSDYQLNSALKKAADDARISFEVRVSMLFDDLEDAQDQDDVKRTVSSWREARDA